MTSSGSSSHDPAGLTLAVNTAEEVLQLVLGETQGKETRLVASQQWEAAGRFAEVLMPGLADLLADSGLTAKDLGRIACVRGPGSFTGLRIGLASVAGLAAGLNIPTAGLDHPALLALHAAPGLTGSLAVCIHARTRQVAFQAFSCPSAEPLGPTQSLTLEQAAEAVSELERPVRLTGTGIRRNQEFFQALATDHVTLLDPKHNRYPDHILLAAAARAEYSHTPIEPAYLRPSDAEENLDSIARSRGLTPDKARSLLDRARGNS